MSETIHNPENDISEEAWSSETNQGYSPLWNGEALQLSTGPLDSATLDTDCTVFYAHTHTNHTNQEEPVVERHFEALADQALRALDDDYQRTLLQLPTANDTAATGSATPDSDEPLPSIRLPAEDFGSDFFVTTDFDDNVVQEATTVVALPPPRAVPTDISIDAVRRAIQRIQLIHPQLDDKWDQWQRKSTHPILPKTVLNVFRGSAVKSNDNEASAAKLTRAATLAEALARLHLIECENMVIDIIGCDATEAQSSETIQQHFQPLADWMDGRSGGPTTLWLRLSGINLVWSETVEFRTHQHLTWARATCHPGIYEDTGQEPMAQLRLAYHAGMYGYREWSQTLRSLAEQRKNIPFVVTAYTLEEAEDDEDSIRQTLSQVLGADLVEAASVWPAEQNRFASLEERVTATALEGRVYRENAAWQAWQI